jgi:uncharacterized membrane protein YuzA (DUF378 family)
MKALNNIALLLLIVGGLNWGLLGLFQFDLVAALFGGQVGPRSGLSNLVYILVGLAALYGIYLFRPLTIGSETHRDVTHRDTTRVR